MTPENLVSYYLDDFGSFLEKSAKKAGSREYMLSFMAGVKGVDKSGAKVFITVKGGKIISCTDMEDFSRGNSSQLSWNDVIKRVKSQNCNMIQISSVMSSFAGILSLKNLTLLPPFDVELLDGKICKLTLASEYFGYKGNNVPEFAGLLVKKYSIDYDKDASQVTQSLAILRDNDLNWFLAVGKGFVLAYFKESRLLNTVRNDSLYPYDYLCITAADTSE